MHMAKKLSVMINEETIKNLETFSCELNEKKESLIEKAIDFYSEQLELKIAEKRLKELEMGETRAIPAEEVYKELGLL